MATSLEYCKYVCEQIECNQMVKYKKMFGEYMIYLNDKPVLMICDNTAYVKILPVLENLMQGAETGYPYKGAKKHYIVDVENRVLLNEVVSVLEKVTKRR